MAMYMKGGEGFVSSELDETGSEGDDGTGKNSANAFLSQEKERVSESEQGTTYSILSVSFFFPLIAQRVQLSRFKTSIPGHCGAGMRSL